MTDTPETHRRSSRKEQHHGDAHLSFIGHPLQPSEAHASNRAWRATLCHANDDAPREVWPLLGTIAGYQLTVAGVLLWFVLPGTGPDALANLLSGIATVAALAAALWLTVSIARAPRARARAA